MFRSIKSILFSLLLVVAFTSCEKELSVENGDDALTGGTQSGTASWILDGAPLLCATPLITGDYVVGTPLDPSNSVVITATVTTVGTYNIATGLINGIQFSGSGTFAGTGIQTITLFGTGTPAIATSANYSPGVNGCSFLVTATTVIVGPVTEGILNCTTASTGGVYTQSIALNATNTVTIPVNVTAAGTYAITTAATNGCTFSGSGTLALGAQTIVLTGSGTPTNLGPISFPVSLGTSNCTFSITFLPAPPPAVGTLTCATATNAGAYVQGLALDGSNTITIPVNVTAAGLYNITATANGVTFFGSGTVATGAQNIVLSGSGTPAASGVFSFPITLGTSSCSVPVTFTAGPAGFFRCKINGVLTSFNVNLLSDTTPLFGGFTIAVEGDVSATTDEHLDFTVNNTSGITPGTYLQPFGVSFATSRYFDPVSGQGYQPSESNSSPALSVIVTSVAGNRIIGTFSGQYFDLNGTGINSKQFTNGEFNVAY